MVALSVLLRFWQEFRSGLAAQRLKDMVPTTATVLRRASEYAPATSREIPLRDVVPGDVVHLSAGDMIPADVRLLASRDLFVSQAVLTGEALPVEKYHLAAPAARSATGAAALDCPDMGFMVRNVVYGTSGALVLATGSQTYLASLAGAIV